MVFLRKTSKLQRNLLTGDQWLPIHLRINCPINGNFPVLFFRLKTGERYGKLRKEQ